MIQAEYRNILGGGGRRDKKRLRWGRSPKHLLYKETYFKIRSQWAKRVVVVSIQSHFDTSWFSRGVNSFTSWAYITRNIHSICFSCSRANYTLSDRNCCAVSMLKFVSTRLCIEMTSTETTGFWPKILTGHPSTSLRISNIWTCPSVFLLSSFMWLKEEIAHREGWVTS